MLETFERLSVALDGERSAQELWGFVDAFMTDSVSKNMKVEQEVSKSLQTEHVPYHLLCKSHTCEKLDESCINTLVAIEKKIEIGVWIVKRKPQLKSFLRKSRSITLCAMDALLKLVSNEGSGKPYSLSKEFDLILE